MAAEGEVLRSAQLGVRVRRGPDWKWDDQDAGGAGTTKEGANAEGWVAVKWDAGGENNYRVGAQGEYDLMVARDPMPAVLRFAQSGLRVRRGPDWKWGDQDGGGPGTTLSGDDHDGCVWVKWDAGRRNKYRIGAEGSYDLIIDSAQPVEVLKSAQLGVRVKRGPDWRWQDQDGGGPGTTVPGADEDGWVRVRWDHASRASNYRVGAQGCHDLVMIDLSPTPSVQPGEVLRSCIAGVRVRRGPDWSWGDQDGGGLGTTRADPDPGWVKVTWDNGGTNSYRVGRGGHYDLIVAQASSPSSQRNITVGSRVRFTEDSRNVDFAECPGTDLSFSVGDTCTVHEVRGDWFIPTRWRNLWAPLRAVELLETSDAMATPMVRPGEVLRSAEVGIRVRRGPDWEWHDQDGGGLGTTVEGSDRDGWVFVKWDAHGREYNYRVERSYDLIVDQSSFLSSAEVGVRVRAAPGWEWGDQDGGGLGTTVEASGPGWVRVRWDHGNTNGYQVGANDTYDLIIAQAPSAQPGEVLRSAQAGVRVRRGPGWSYSDQDGGAGGLGITTGEGRLGVRVRWDWDHGSSEGRYSYRIGPHRFDLIVVGVPGREQADAAEQAPSHTTTSAEPDGGYDEQWLDVAEAASMQCPICMCVARNAMAHDCGNLFCEICWIRWMAEDNPTCPVCRELGEGIVRAPRDRRKISNLMIRCQGCKESIRLADKEKHVSQCPKLVPRSEGEIGQQELSEQLDLT